ncbi:MAG TPA: DUF507 family protein, partial [Thermodesulfovibrionales bacterium]|nr:DUF507 family protein [Thermodesulfovibrionales bacterium]
MMLSDDKVSHLSHILLNKLYDLDLIDMDEDEEASIRREIKRTIVGELKVGEEIDEVVRKKLLSLSKKLIEGSSEWEVLYRKYYREEEIKKG